MTTRPNHIDLGYSSPFDPNRTGSPSPRDLPSPRSGDIPPALSPLDAFALQGRLLAQRLEAENTNGRRVSRLPPLTIANALAQGRNNYFSPRSPNPIREDSQESPKSSGPDTSGNSPEVSQPRSRPRSQYPQISAFDDAASIISQEPLPTIRQVKESDQQQDERPTERPFTADSTDSKAGQTGTSLSDVSTRAEESNREPRPSQFLKKTPTNESLQSRVPNVLMHPPRSPLSPPQPSRSPRPGWDQTNKRPVRMESGDDSDTLSVHGQISDTRFADRKPSFGNGIARSRSPFSPVFAPPRSPSVASDYSLPARASVNFSRPISRADRPSLETRPSYEGSLRSLESPPLRPSVDVLSLQESLMDSPRVPAVPWVDGTTPLSLTDDESSPRPGTPSGSTSYTHSRFTLPRGRAPSKNSVQHQDEDSPGREQPRPLKVVNITNTLLEDQVQTQSPIESIGSEARPSTSSGGSIEAPPIARTMSASETASTVRGIHSLHKSNPSFPPPSISGSSTISDRTIRPGQPPTLQTLLNDHRSSPLSRPMPHTFQNTPTTPDPGILADALLQLTPEGHLNKGISCHEDGELMKSTYHLRLAARGGNATGMLLYALACRHGWGMRPNQEEGVLWLRKAVDSAGLEVAEDENPASNITVSSGDGGEDARPVKTDILTQKTHKAKLALAIYELGVSYMNGWGIAQDKALALRCFEIAGGWGDGDALAEAGFCYAKGVGCKKDLKRAADFYRRAEKRGVEMAGNSWIYKDKYMPPSVPSTTGGEDSDRKGRSAEKDKEKKSRDKSRTRAIFGGRKNKS